MNLISIAENKNSDEINQLKHFIYQGILHAFSSVHIALVRDFFFINHWYNVLQKEASLRNEEGS